MDINNKDEKYIADVNHTIFGKHEKDDSREESVNICDNLTCILF